MKATFEKIRNWYRGAVEDQSETGSLSISIEAWIPESGGPELKIDIEVKRIEREMMKIIRDLCERSDEVEFQFSIEEMEEVKCHDSMNA